MGTGPSKDLSNGSYGSGEQEGNLEQAGGQLYLSLRMENYKVKGELIPHVYGSVPLIGSWDSSKALPMVRESSSMWELSFVVPSNHETFDFKFLLKPKHESVPCLVEEGPSRLLTGGTLQGDAGTAMFRFSADDILYCSVFINADRVSPFDLAASWRAYQENLQPSIVRGIPDVSINAIPSSSNEATLELDLERYVVPARVSSSSWGTIYAANMAEDPRLLPSGVSSGFGSCDDSVNSRDVSLEVDPHTMRAKESNALCEQFHPASDDSKSKVDDISLPSQQIDSGKDLIVDGSEGSSHSISKCSTLSDLDNELKLDTEKKSVMPAAAGAVTAAAVADQMFGLEEDRHLAIVLVGLPARGKTFTAAKLTRYLRWLGHDTKHFNVGKYRRLKHGVNQTADFFRGDNLEGVEARNEIWTSTLQRTILTASPIVGFPKIQWRALDEINAGVCDGMTYDEIQKNMSEEYESRKKDKLRYRYPRGESYLDVIQRLY